MRSSLTIILGCLLSGTPAAASQGSAPYGPAPHAAAERVRPDGLPHVPPIPETGALDFKKKKHPGVLVLGLGAGVVSGWAATKTLDMRDIMESTDDRAELNDAFARQKRYAWTSRASLAAAAGFTVTYAVW